MDRDELLKLYELTLDEEHYYVGLHQRYVAWYAGIITALIAAMAAGLLQAEEWYHFAALSAGPVLLFLVSTNAVEGATRPYQRFLETITVRAKIEQELGLTDQRRSDADTDEPYYWRLEPIVPLRHIESRNSYESSSAFIEQHLTKGAHHVIARLFRLLRWLSVLLLIVMVFLTIWQAGLL